MNRVEQEQQMLVDCNEMIEKILSLQQRFGVDFLDGLLVDLRTLRELLEVDVHGALPGLTVT